MKELLIKIEMAKILKKSRALEAGQAEAKTKAMTYSEEARTSVGTDGKIFQTR